MVFPHWLRTLFPRVGDLSRRDRRFLRSRFRHRCHADHGVVIAQKLERRTLLAAPDPLDLGTLDGTNGFRLDGVAASDYSGFSVSGAGDVNGDGFDDLLIGALGADPNGNSSGSSYVVFGRSGGFASVIDLSTLDGTNGFRFDGVASADRSGGSVTSAGDVNGDGFDDLLVGAHYADPNSVSSGSSYVLFGRSGGFASVINLSSLDGTTGFRLDGVAAGDFSGYSVSSAGDVNGDGFDDVLVGAFRADSNGNAAAGSSYVVFGRSGGFASAIDFSTLDGTNGFRLDGVAAGDESGHSVSSAGDVNGDGFDDLLIGANRADSNGSSSGSTHVLFGKSDGFASVINLSTLEGTTGFRLDGVASGDYSGRSVSSAEDVNGDGFDDLLVGALGADPNGSSSGSSYVVFGRSGGFASVIDLSTLDGTNGIRLDGVAAGDQSGRSVSSAGDVNGDGFDDLFVGAQGASPNALSGAGANYVLFGRSGGFASVINLSSLDGTTGFRLDGVTVFDQSGVSVSGAGDVNGDGFDDLIVGAVGADPNGGNSGSSYVVFGGNFTGGVETQVGGDGSQLLNATMGSGVDVLIGGRGNDILTSDGGDDVLRGGEGHDLLVISDIDFSGTRRLEGGTGTDILGLSSHGTLDLTAIADNRITGIEVIDLAVNQLIVTPSEVLRLSDSSNTLTVIGGIGADVPITPGTWEFQGTVNLNGADFKQYTNGAATLNVEVGIDNSLDAEIHGQKWHDLNGDGVRNPGEPGLSGWVIELLDSEGTLVGTQTTTDVDLNADGTIDPQTERGLYSFTGLVPGIYTVGEVLKTGWEQTFPQHVATLPSPLPVEPLPSLPLLGSAGHGVAFDGSSLLVHSGSSILFLDPVTGSENRSIPTSASLRGMDFSDGEIVTINSTGLVNFLDPSDGAVARTLDASAAAMGRYLMGMERIGSELFVLASYTSSDPLTRDHVFVFDAVDGSLIRDYTDPGGSAHTTDVGGLMSLSGELWSAYGSFVGLTRFDPADGFGSSTGTDPYDLFRTTSSPRISGLASDGVGKIFALDRVSNEVDVFEFPPTLPTVRLSPGETVANVDFGNKLNSLPANLSALDGTIGFRVDGLQASDLTAYSVSNAGDVNGDGFHDVIIGAWAADQNGSASGSSYVVFGRSGGFASAINVASLDGTNGFRVDGVLIGDQSARAVSGAGDINGDGLDDLIIGAPRATLPNGSDSGASYVVFGRSGGFPSAIQLSSLDGTNGFVLAGITPDQSGHSVSSAGDINGDGFDELIVGTPYASSSGTPSGSNFVVFGRSGGFSSVIHLSSLDGTTGFRIDGAASGDLASRAVSSAGDVNGDGFEDLIVGAPGTDPNGSASGSAYVVFGHSDSFSSVINLSTLDGTNGFRVDGDAASDQLGLSANEAGDVNGDGFDDVIFSAHLADPNGAESGSSFVVFGRSGGFASAINLSTLDGTTGFRLDGVAANDRAGRSVSGAGDINGDGFDDLIIGTYQAEVDGNPYAGSSYVFFGHSGSFSSVINLSVLDGTTGLRLAGVSSNDQSGHAVSRAGDVNGDGFDDLIIGAHTADPVGPNSGSAYVVFGGNFTGGAETQVGGDGAQTLNATLGAGVDILIGGRGDDTLISDGGDDVLRGGEGDDILAIPDVNFSPRRLQGGTGVDTLRLDGAGLSLDLTSIADNRISGIEQIDITGSGANTLTLDVREVLRISGSSNTLIVRRDINDVVNTSGGWEQQTDEMIGGNVFEVFSQGAATLKVQSGFETFVVNSTVDLPDATPLGDGIVDVDLSTPGAQITLRAAIQESNALAGDQTIILGPDTYTLSIVGSGEELAATGDLDITDTSGTLSIIGDGSESTIIDGAGLDRVFHVLAGVTVSFSDVAITGGDSVATGSGGGIFNDDGTVNVIRGMILGNTATGGGGLSNVGGGVVTITESTISGNTVPGTGSAGGGLFNSGFSFGNSTMTIVNSTVSGNSAGQQGGGILNSGTLTITNSTFSGNVSGGGGGAVYNNFGLSVQITNSTITDNVANGTSGDFQGGGGITDFAGNVTAKNTLIAGNTAATGDPDVRGSFISQGNNLIGDVGSTTGFTDGVNGDQIGTSGSPIDPLLGVLQDNGGPTQTHALLAGSPAIDTGSNTGAPATDQRGAPRPQGTAVDIGAYEAEEVHITTFDINGNHANRSGIRELTIAFSDAVVVGSAASLKLFNHTTGQTVSLVGATLVNDGTTSPSWGLSTVVLPDGRYTAEIPASATSPDLVGTYSFTFHKLAGDLDGDGTVNFNDTVPLSLNFGASGATYIDGDADGDGLVNFNDTVPISLNFGVSLPELTYDFGDAPEIGTMFPTTLANNGARHVITGNTLFLGADRDAEPDGQPSTDAMADGPDENGFDFDSLIRGTNVNVAVTSSGEGFINGWIDFNRDGDWDDLGEQVFDDVPVTAGANNLQVAVPAAATLGTTFSRFRLTADAGYSYFGLARDGEVEDYQLTVADASPDSADSLAESTSEDPIRPLTGLWSTPIPIRDLSAIPITPVSLFGHHLSLFTNRRDANARDRILSMDQQ